MNLLMFYAFLALGLLVDGAALFRITIFCAALHELGHVLVYVCIAHRLPRLCLRAGGVAMHHTVFLSVGQQCAVLCAGPLANFLFALALWVAIQSRASYGAYFFMATSLCVGLYNLLPLGTLDGAQLLRLFVPARLEATVYFAQQMLLRVVCAALPLCAVLCELPRTARVGAFVAAAYLFVQNALS